MSYPIAEPIREAVLKETRDGTLGYNDPISIGAARESLANWMRISYSWDVRPSSIGFTSDIVSGFAAVLRHFLPPGAPIVVPTPAYNPFLTVPGLIGHPVIRVPMLSGSGEFRMDFGGIEKALAAGGRMVVLCHPHNPTGRSFTREELSTLADIVKAHGARVFSDEVHAPLSLTDRTHIPYASLGGAAGEHTITATSASKAWNISGLKCSQLIFSSPEDAAAWTGVADFYIRSVSRLGVAALRAAYEMPASRDWLDATLVQLRVNNGRVARAVRQGMPGINYIPAESTYLAWLDCTGLGLAEPAEHFLRNARVALCEGVEFDSPGYVRLNFALPETMLGNALEALCAASARQ
ncbi:MalY/PatB family protein [Streptomyces yangpuensis]|uniref:MalY/PatB family protein n=1 Tax=Streptomyces yangpuensis TaxID=1648182 RepID=UPI003816128B